VYRVRERAGVEFEALATRGGTTWPADAATSFVGDCHLFAGRPVPAFDWFLRSAEEHAALGDRGNLALQAAGCACSLADLGRSEEALELLGAADMVYGDWRDPTNLSSAWGARVDANLNAARDALPPAVADKAYARGNALKIDEVVPRLQAIAESLAVTA
jgi:hypothetical protein